MATYVALGTVIDRDGLEDILEMRDVQSSWEAAVRRNLEEAQKRRR